MTTFIESKETLSLYQEFIDLINSPMSSWLPVKEEEGIRIWNRDHDYAPSTMLSQRVECLFPNVKPDVAYEIFADLRIRKKWDHRLAEYHLLEVTSDY